MRAAIGLAVLALGCADLLGYDDYRARAADATVETPAFDAENEAVTDGPQPSGGVRPPTRPPGVAEPSGKGKTVWLIVNHFYLNQDEFPGSGDDLPWKYIGYDLDGVCTGERESRENTGTCKRVPGGEQDDLIDGLLCRDNNFGSQLVPIVSAVDGRYEKTSNEAVTRGSATWILRLEDVDDGPDDPYVVGSLYKAAPWFDFNGETSPNFTTDPRDIDHESVIDKDINKPRTHFKGGWIRDHVFVSGDPGSFVVTLPIQAATVEAPLAGAVLTLKLDETHTKGELGVLAGAIPSKNITTVVQPIAEQVGLCPGAVIYENFIRNIGRMMDVVVDTPTLHDTTQTCNGLSLGMAFTAVPLPPATKAIPPPPRAGRCKPMSDAGADG